MQVTYQLNAEDYYQGLLAWRSRNAWLRWFLRIAYFVVGSAFLISLADVLFARNAARLQTSLSGIAFAAIWFAIMWFGPRFSARRQFRNSPTAQSPIMLNATETGLEIRSAHGESRVLWTAFVAWSERKSVFVILPQPRIYYPIPKRAFTDEQLSEFRELLRNNIGKK